MGNVAHTIITKGLKVNEGILMATRGPNSGREYVLVGQQIVIGRGEDCDIVLNDINVSRHHARIHATGGDYLITDLKSKNGIFVNQKRVRERALQEGDQLAIGESVFRFRYGRPNSTRSRSMSVSADQLKSSKRSDKANRPDSQPARREATANGFHAHLVSKRSEGLLFKLAQSFFGGKSKVLQSRPKKGINQLSIWIGIATAALLSYTLMAQFRPQPKQTAALSTAVKKTNNVKVLVNPPGIRTASMGAAVESDTAVKASKATTLTQKSLARERYAQGMQALDGGDYRRAITLFEEVAKLDPQHPVIAAKLQLAKSHLQAAVEEYYNSGLREFSKLYYDRAIREWEKSAALSLGFAQDYYEKSMVKIQEAQEKLQESR